MSDPAATELDEMVAIAERLFPAIAQRWRTNRADPRILVTVARAFLDAQRNALACRCFGRAVALAPDILGFREEWARALVSIGEHDRAAEELRTAVARSPDNAEGHRALAKLLFWRLNGADEAIEILATLTRQTGARYDAELLAECVARYPGLQDASAGTIAGSLVERMSSVLGRSVDRLDVMSIAATALMRAERCEDALGLAELVCRHRPNETDALCTLGWSLTFLGRPEDARPRFEHALSTAPENHYAAWSLRRNWHSLGFYEASRNLWMNSRQLWTEVHMFPYAAPAWDGADLEGRTIRLRYERNFGFGDSLQFVRFAKWLAERGAEVVVVTRLPLVDLLARADGVQRALSAYEDAGNADFDCPAAASWMVLNVPMSQVSRSTQYLHVEPDDVARWRSRVTAGGKLLVGVAWQASDADGGFRRRPMCGPRSMPLSALQPLSQVPGVRLCSLQKQGVTRASPQVVPMVDVTTELNSFYDAAALTAAMDAVVTVDTSIAHLAGALGRPTMVLLPHAASWLWEVQRRDSPWYPTVSLFRQMRRGSWTAPIEAVVSRLESMRAGKAPDGGDPLSSMFR
jgi:tetratricopeptide (TPR) repeat protein